MNFDGKTKKRLAVVTGTRAEYGLLRPVLQQLYQRNELEIQLFVTGAHLSDAFGNTVAEIEKDGFPITERIDILKFGTGNSVATAHTVAYTVEKFTEVFQKLKTDACLVLGDRYEIFAVSTAAALLRIPVLHISGGDVTKGAADDWMRHCITKMASLHFPSCETYANRIVRMGEEPQRVYNVGGLGDENIRNLELLSLKELSESVEMDLNDTPFLLVTYHPETLAEESPETQFQALLHALERLPQIAVLFTKANADAGGEEINACIDAYVQKHKNCKAFTSLGVLRYLSAMRYAVAVVGNSSSGVVETPSFGTPCVNIGNRQAGRIICENVICCDTKADAIYDALQKALSQPFQAAAHAAQSPYRGAHTSEDIARICAEFLYGPLCGTVKSFYDGERGE